MLEEGMHAALLEEFFSENRETLHQIEAEMLELERDPGNRETLNTVFRGMHTLKGNCRMLGFERTESLTHAAETLLDSLRTGQLVMNQRIGGALLHVLDVVRLTMDRIETEGGEGDVDFSSLIQSLHACQGEAVVEMDPDSQDEESSPALEGGHGPVAGEKTANPQSVRLSIERLDQLMNMVGELGAAFSQLRYLLLQDPSHSLQAVEGMEQRIRILQDEVLKYRLQPLGPVFETYHRLIRDLAVDTGKKVILEMSGEETEVDRNILVSIKEIMGHLVRNAMDHGIEPPEERLKRGKPAVGRLVLSAQRKHGQILLALEDDGRGILPDVILQAALEKGILSESRAREISSNEIIQLIMVPGFSTARTVSRISGRGTGMDVVQAALKKINGSIRIQSQPGKGTCFHLGIPQTMAIVSVLMVTVHGVQYGIPQTSILEMVSYYGEEEIRRQVEVKMGALMVRVRDRIVPALSLGSVLEVTGGGADSSRIEDVFHQREVHCVLVQSEEKPFALEVDHIEGTASLVIKPMLQLFSDITVLAGSTVMADGSVAFLLNISELEKQLDG